MRISDCVIHDVHIDDMPNSDMRMVAEFCGLETALVLLKELPGVKLIIPKCGPGLSVVLKGMQIVYDKCGQTVADALLRELPGIALNIPKFGFKYIVVRYIRKNYRPGDARLLALQCCVTERFVYTVMKDGYDNKKGRGRETGPLLF